MLDLSADNRDGFEDTDGQLYTSNSLFYFCIREMNTSFNERRVIFMILRIKIIIAEFIRKVCCISPKWGNRVMDILGYDNYCRVAKYWKFK